MKIKKSPHLSWKFQQKIFRDEKWTFLSGFGMKMIKKVDTRYFYSSFLDGATATNIQEAFMSGIKELDKNNFLQISSDRPNVN